jgi:hypothetical protein
MRFDEREFWTKYFDELGLPIPDGVPGSHPQQILDQMELLNRTAEIQYR